MPAVDCRSMEKSLPLGVANLIPISLFTSKVNGRRLGIHRFLKALLAVGQYSAKSKLYSFDLSIMLRLSAIGLNIGGKPQPIM